MRGIEKDPGNFVESAEVLKDEVSLAPQSQPQPQAPKSAAPIPPPHIDPVPLERVLTEPPKPIIVPKPVVKTLPKQVEEPDLKEMVAEMVRAEVRQNRAAYENKTTEDMEVLFRQMLIRKLAGSGGEAKPKPQTIDKVAAPAKKSMAAAKCKKMTFKVKPPQVSEDEEESEEVEE